jgi:hypothetical protein
MNKFFYKYVSCKLYKCHIIGLIKDNNEEFIIYKWFGIYKRQWHYEIEYKRLFDMLIKGNVYKWRI